MLSKGQITIQQMNFNETYCAIYWIKIYLLDSIVYPLNQQHWDATCKDYKLKDFLKNKSSFYGLVHGLCPIIFFDVIYLFFSWIGQCTNTFFFLRFPLVVSSVDKLDHAAFLIGPYLWSVKNRFSSLLGNFVFLLFCVFSKCQAQIFNPFCHALFCCPYS